MGKMIVLCGMVASGKSTYCRNAARAGQLILNDDAIVTMLHGDEYTLYNKDFKILYKSVENHIISTALAMGKTILVDRGLNVSLQGRQRWIALARSFDVDCEAIVFPHDGVETHARRRHDGESRGHKYDYWLMVADAHNKVYTTPTVEEGFSKVHRINFDEILAGKVIE